MTWTWELGTGNLKLETWDLRLETWLQHCITTEMIYCRWTSLCYTMIVIGNANINRMCTEDWLVLFEMAKLKNSFFPTREWGHPVRSVPSRTVFYIEGNWSVMEVRQIADVFFSLAKWLPHSSHESSDPHYPQMKNNRTGSGNNKAGLFAVAITTFQKKKKNPAFAEPER